LLKKNEPPGRKITLKINKWALLKETACNKMKSTTYPYHVVLVPKTKHKKGNESGINYPGELKKTPDSSRGHKISTRNGSEIDSDLTYKFEKLDRSSQGVFVSKNQTKVTSPLQPRARDRFTPAIFPLFSVTNPIP
jgi:hypothetical protein